MAVSTNDRLAAADGIDTAAQGRAACQAAMDVLGRAIAHLHDLPTIGGAREAGASYVESTLDYVVRTSRSLPADNAQLLSPVERLRVGQCVAQAGDALETLSDAAVDGGFFGILVVEIADKMSTISRGAIEVSAGAVATGVRATWPLLGVAAAVIAVLLVVRKVGIA